MKAYAIHTIHRRSDPEGEIEVIPAGAVFDATADDLDISKMGSLAREGAARPATKVDEAHVADLEIDPLALRSLQTEGGETGTLSRG